MLCTLLEKLEREVKRKQESAHDFQTKNDSAEDQIKIAASEKYKMTFCTPSSKVKGT